MPERILIEQDGPRCKPVELSGLLCEADFALLLEVENPFASGGQWSQDLPYRQIQEDGIRSETVRQIPIICKEPK